jgi:hypothetical protein
VNRTDIKVGARVYFYQDGNAHDGEIKRVINKGEHVDIDVVTVDSKGAEKRYPYLNIPMSVSKLDGTAILKPEQPADDEMESETEDNDDEGYF